MDPGVWSEDTTILLGGCTAEHLSAFQPAPSNPDATGASGTLHPHSEDTNSVSGYNNRGEAASSFLHSSPLETDAPCGESSGRRHPEGCDLNDSRQAKRARVENIIRGMTGSPGMFEPTDCMRGKGRIGEPSLLQDLMRGRGCGGAGRGRTRRQVESQQQLLRQLRKKFYRKDGTRGNGTERNTTWQPLPPSPSDTFPDSLSEFEDRFRETTKLRSKPERVKLMADVLKYQLSRAVSRSVDSVFKNMPLLQTSANHEGVQTDVPLHSSACEDGKIGLSRRGNEMVQIPDVQTEALSLVVQKPGHETSDKFLLRPNWKVHPDPAASFSQDYAHMNPSETKLNADVRWFQGGNSEVDRAKMEMFDAHWTSVKVRSKVKSRSVRSSQSPTLSEKRSFPRIKIESDTLVKNNLYVFNEGLTTRHLKKAKLMFFYTRYPSSAVLRMCFHDVKFTRCITSQLIKWFSNFREFFYIQIEKFARHALVGGVSDVRALTVERESELFRALNVHYNKASDFQVPDRFLEVAELTLREFYISISMGKDRDPSWKKAIYKVICKLDSDVPDEFKNQHFG